VPDAAGVPPPPVDVEGVLVEPVCGAEVSGAGGVVTAPAPLF
jgi:hypothetical protein